jgi:dolichol-phosphate mannosyltransferase
MGSKTSKLVVVMPAWNEEEGIEEFIEEISSSLDSWDLKFVVVNDCSSDATSKIITKMIERSYPIFLYENQLNLGHGPSFIKAMQIGLSLNPDLVLTVDGDGQFLGKDLARLADLMNPLSNIKVIEGVRNGRSDPYYRKFVTFATRILIFSKTGVLPRDANSPLRVYESETLRRILQCLSSDITIPNLLISLICRRWKLNYLEVEVTSLPRRGENVIGNTWGGKIKFIPTKRFFKFCIVAVGQWNSFKVADLKK